MDAKEMKFQAQLEEYKQLRAEIFQDFRSSDVRYTILVLAYTAAITLMVSIFEEPDPFLVLITAFIPLVIWIMEIERSYGVAHTGTYIAFMLEKELHGLNWESYVMLTKLESIRSFRLPINWLVFSLMAISIVVSVSLLVAGNNSLAHVSVWWIALSLIIILWLYAFLRILLLPLWRKNQLQRMKEFKNILKKGIQEEELDKPVVKSKLLTWLINTAASYRP